jgi:hypothetical protein
MHWLVCSPLIRHPNHGTGWLTHAVVSTRLYNLQGCSLQTRMKKPTGATSPKPLSPGVTGGAAAKGPASRWRGSRQGGGSVRGRGSFAPASSRNKRRGGRGHGRDARKSALPARTSACAPGQGHCCALAGKISFARSVASQ